MTFLEVQPTSNSHPSAPVLVGLSRSLLLNARICPEESPCDGRLRIAVTSGYAPDVLDDLAVRYGAVELVLDQVTDAELQRRIERLAGRSADQLEASPEPDDELPSDVRDLADESETIRQGYLLLSDAQQAGASDLHLEPTPSGLRSRLRCDGVLVPGPPVPSQIQHSLLPRFKHLARLDLAERRKPQDGRIRMHGATGTADIRVATLPTMHGEAMSLRFLDGGGAPLTLTELGMSAPVREGIEEIATAPQGLLLVIGPTGSGKTATLNAALRLRDRELEKIITVEDPVEHQLPGVVHAQLNETIGVTVESVLRSILRHDPDVIMIGEIRDPRTATLAMQAAMTGHMVLSTLHTMDAVAAVPRLLDLDVPEYLVAATLSGVLAQRLVRTICSECREPWTPPAHSVEAFFGTALPDETVLARGRGCAACRGTGYRGRVGVFELLRVTDPIREAIAHRLHRGELLEMACGDGMRLLLDDARDKVRAGVTTMEEVLRVVR
jgi:type II secretory ATPase GspE/PulE/Tfp pilus assembly ATPase PilB-like protein